MIVYLMKPQPTACAPTYAQPLTDEQILTKFQIATAVATLLLTVKQLFR